jgi:hypothetical protein
VVLLVTNIAIDQITGDTGRSLTSLLIGAAVGGAVFGLVLHLWGKRTPAA